MAAGNIFLGFPEGKGVSTCVKGQRVRGIEVQRQLACHMPLVATFFQHMNRS